MQPRPTAIVAANDEVAAGVIQAAWRLGMQIPAQLSVVGFDDVPLAKQLCPPLTTVSQPIREIAKSAISILIEHLIRGKGEIRNVEVPTQLIVRQSTLQLTERATN
jgi:LacI family transcriptional regulator